MIEKDKQLINNYVLGVLDENTKNYVLSKIESDKEWFLAYVESNFFYKALNEHAVPDFLFENIQKGLDGKVLERNRIRLVSVAACVLGLLFLVGVYFQNENFVTVYETDFASIEINSGDNVGNITLYDGLEEDIYQLWGVDDEGVIISLGVLGSEPRNVPFSVVNVETLVITQEESPVSVSSQDPLITVEI